MCLHITGVFRALCDVAPPPLQKKKKILKLSGSGYPAYLPNKAKKMHINLLSI